jgi:hypothetical protein
MCAAQRERYANLPGAYITSMMSINPQPPACSVLLLVVWCGMRRRDERASARAGRARGG